MESLPLDAAGHRRSPATMPGYHRGRPPRNKGEQYPADPPTIEEIIAVMRIVGARANGARLRALIVLLWRATGHPRGRRRQRASRQRSPRLSAGQADTEVPCSSVRVPCGSWTWSRATGAGRRNPAVVCTP
jgi:hypothetical protein